MAGNDIEARLEACESIIVSLLTLMPEIEFGFLRASMLNQRPSDDRPLPPAPPDSLKHIQGLIEDAKQGRIQLTLNSQRDG